MARPSLSSPAALLLLSTAVLASPACSSEVTVDGSGGGSASSSSGWQDPPPKPICVPHAAYACYSGPPGTLGAGTCAAGSWTCNDDGLGFGPCLGDVTPGDDPCPAGGPTCQGAPACAVTTAWSKRFQGTQQDGATAVATDAAGNVYVTGFFMGSIDFGAGLLEGDDGTMYGFLLKLGPAGNTVWSKQLGKTSATGWVAESLVLDAAGNLFLSGYFHNDGTLDLGGGPLTAQGQMDAFVARFDPQGNHVWSRRWSAGNDTYDARLGLDAAGNAALAGSYDEPAADGYSTQMGVFLTRWSPSGDLLWSEKFPVYAYDAGPSLAVDLQGDIYLAGGFGGTVSFGGPVLDAGSNKSTYLAKLDPAGNHLWSERLGGDADVEALGLLADDAGRTWVTGSYQGPANFGLGSLAGLGEQPFLARFDSNGAPLWAADLGGSTTSGQAITLAAAPGGEVVVAGTFRTKDDIAKGIASDQMFLTRRSATGAPIWGKSYKGSISVDVTRIALDGADNVLAAGGYDGTVDFGTGVLAESNSWIDMFITKIAAP